MFRLGEEGEIRGGLQSGEKEEFGFKGERDSSHNNEILWTRRRETIVQAFRMHFIWWNMNSYANNPIKTSLKRIDKAQKTPFGK